MPGDIGVMDYGGEAFAKMAKRHAAAYGLGVCTLSRKAPVRAEAAKIRNCSFVWIWNGFHDNSAQFRELCTRQGIPFALCEWGLLPQADTFSIDPSGFCRWSSLNGDLSWVDKVDTRRLVDARNELRRQHPERDDGYVLVPLQIGTDTQILYNTPYRTMQEFADHLQAVFPTERLIFRKHPKDSTPYRARSLNAKVCGEGGFMDVLAGAKSVVGLTSTCLLEAAIYGKPVLALGDCPLRTHAPRNHDRVAAGALAMRLARANADPTPVLERFGLRPLGCEPVGVKR